MTTMKWIKTPPEIIAQFDAAAPKGAGIVRKPMFGYPALYLKVNMFAGTYQDKVVVRLSAEERTKAARYAKAVPFEPMPGRAMREYMVLPKAVVATAKLAQWIECAHAYAATLPAKTPRSTTPRTAKKPTARKGTK